MFNPKFNPSTQQKNELFSETQKHFFALLKQVLKTAVGKKLVRSNIKTMIPKRCSRSF